MSHRSWLIRFSSTVVSCLGLLLLVGMAFAQDQPPAKNAGTPASAAQPAEFVRAYPGVDFGGGRRLDYIGAFSPDGKFKKLTKFGRFVDKVKTASSQSESSQDKSSAPPAAPVRPQHDAPASEQRVVQDFGEGTHAVKAAEPGSRVEDLRDSIIRKVYGTDRLLQAPQNLTTDSRQRVIVADPGGHALEVLDYEGKQSFRIVGGEGHRLRSPRGVAVDENDNIYVTDYERGMILVYDSQGGFLRYLGSVSGENMYQGPTGIAIDRDSGYVYVVDTPRHVVQKLDLEGHVLGHFGRRGGGTAPGEFKNPTAIAVHGQDVVVLDQDGTRVQVLQSDGTPVKQFSLPAPEPKAAAPELCMDGEGTIYVSDAGRGAIRAYSRDGQLLKVFGRPGSRSGEFGGPTGVWADADNRLYVVESDSGRIQIFQLSGGAATSSHSGVPSAASR